MCIMEVLRKLDNVHPKGLHNIIVHIYYMLLKDGPVLPPHYLSQLKA